MAEALLDVWVIGPSPLLQLLGQPQPGCSSAAVIFSCTHASTQSSPHPLAEYRKDMGEIKPDTIVTLHLVIRPQQTNAKQQGEV